MNVCALCYVHVQRYMFYEASVFDQNLCRWDKKKSALTDYFCSGGASCGPIICPPSSKPSQSSSSLPTKELNIPTISPKPVLDANSARTLVIIGLAVAFGIVLAGIIVYMKFVKHADAPSLPNLSPRLLRYESQEMKNSNILSNIQLINK